jgi:hypothetical protein
MSDKKPIVKFVKGNTIMSMDTKDYYLFDKSEEYFSMTPFNREDCIDGETIIEVNWGNGYQGIKIVSAIPNEISGYEKI